MDSNSDIEYACRGADVGHGDVADVARGADVYVAFGADVVGEGSAQVSDKGQDARAASCAGSLISIHCLELLFSLIAVDVVDVACTWVESRVVAEPCPCDVDAYGSDSGIDSDVDLVVVVGRVAVHVYVAGLHGSLEHGLRRGVVVEKEHVDADSRTDRSTGYIDGGVVDLCSVFRLHVHIAVGLRSVQDGDAGRIDLGLDGGTVGGSAEDIQVRKDGPVGESP